MSGSCTKSSTCPSQQSTCKPTTSTSSTTTTTTPTPNNDHTDMASFPDLLEIDTTAARSAAVDEMKFAYEQATLRLNTHRFYAPRRNSALSVMLDNQVLAEVEQTLPTEKHLSRLDQGDRRELDEVMGVYTEAVSAYVGIEEGEAVGTGIGLGIRMEIVQGGGMEGEREKKPEVELSA